MLGGLESIIKPLFIIFIVFAAFVVFWCLSSGFYFPSELQLQALCSNSFYLSQQTLDLLFVRPMSDSGSSNRVSRWFYKILVVLRWELYYSRNPKNSVRRSVIILSSFEENTVFSNELSCMTSKCKIATWVSFVTAWTRFLICWSKNLLLQTSLPNRYLHHSDC